MRHRVGKVVGVIINNAFHRWEHKCIVEDSPEIACHSVFIYAQTTLRKAFTWKELSESNLPKMKEESGIYRYR
jgi:hypothetical protein